MFTVVQTITFRDWLADLRDPRARDRIASRITRLGTGNFGDTRHVGSGVAELRIDYGPGYRVYFKRTELTVVVLLCGGDKSTQTADIARAIAMAQEIEVPLETIRFDAAEVLSEEGVLDLLREAFESGDGAFIATALGVAARHRGMSAVAKDAGVSREALYRALSERGDPKLSTLLGVAKALDVQFTVVRKPPQELAV